MNTSAKELTNFQTSFLIKKLKIYSDALRLKEILLIGGVTFIGLVSNTDIFNFHILSLWLIAMLCSYSLLAYAFLSNDWSGFEYDVLDPNKSNRALVKGEISLMEVKFLCVVFLVISLGLSVFLSYLTFIIAVSIALLNYLYSGSKVFLKNIPVASSMLHGLGATLGFLIGYTFQGSVDLNGVMLGAYFGIIYAAGHLNHEISDSESDEMSSINTNANLFGTRRAFIGSFSLFTLSFLYVIFLSIKALLPFAAIWGVILAYPFYAYFFYKTLKTKLDHKSMMRFRKKYRIIFLLWGTFLVAIILLNNWFK